MRPGAAIVLFAVISLGHALSWAADMGPIKVDVPVTLKKAEVVYNLDHAAFVGDMPAGIMHMGQLKKRLVEWGTKGRIVGVFHGSPAYLTLNDRAYNANRHVSTGNPYKGPIADLLKQGVEIEECAVSMQNNKWNNGDLLPGVKVTSGAVLRIISLVQQGYVQIQP